jgi:CheY-like chemotaxis protein
MPPHPETPHPEPGREPHFLGSGRGNAQPTGGPGVLVVDNEPLILRVIGFALSRAGLRCWLAGSGEEAVQLYQQHQENVRLALVDLHMPGMSGLQTLAALRAVNPSVVVYLLTGGTADPVEVQQVEREANGVLHKPFQLDDLARVLANVVHAC